MSRWEDDIEITSHAGFLKVLDYPLSLTAGVGILPSNYFRLIGDPYYTAPVGENDPSPNRVFIDVVTSKEHTYRQRDYLTQASLSYPTCVIGAQNANKEMQIRVYPSSINTIYLNYVRDTVSPFLDYYVNSVTLQTTYLLEGETKVIAGDNVYRDGTTGTKVSQTKDFEFDDHELPWILAYFLQILGVALPDDLLAQVGKIDSSELQGGKVW
jgi:hypothetical protein